MTDRESAKPWRQRIGFAVVRDAQRPLELDVHLQATRLNARGVEEVAYEFVETVSLFFDSHKAQTQGLGLEYSVGASERRGIALDNGYGSLQFV